MCANDPSGNEATRWRALVPACCIGYDGRGDVVRRLHAASDRAIEEETDPLDSLDGSVERFLVEAC